MPEDRVGVRDLKSRLSHYLRQVAQGNVLIVTDRGKPLAEIRPVSEKPEDKLAALVASGRVRWSGKRLKVTAPLASVYPGKSVADLILRDRE